MPQTLQTVSFTHLSPPDAALLAFYALDSALQPPGVFVDCDTHEWDTEIAHINSLPAHARFQLGLALLQQCHQAV